MSLEDEVQDVVGKAMRCAGMSAGELARASGLDEAEVRGILEGDCNQGSLLVVAPALGLDPQALAELPDYSPETVKVGGVGRLEVPFRDWTVNAWILEHGDTRLLFDTGWNDQDVLNLVDAESLDAVFITHPDPDHIGGVEAFQENGVRVIPETEALETGSYRFGEIEIRVMDLAGHRVPAAGYLISGFERQLWVVGDAIFAGSMGGCPSPERFEQAFSTLRKEFSVLEDEVLILPGHGPMTSVGAERVSNPFHCHFNSAKDLR